MTRRPLALAAAALSAFVLADAAAFAQTDPAASDGPRVVTVTPEGGAARVTTGDAAPERPRIEVVFAIDATSSMADEIEQVKQHLWATAQQIMNGTPRPEVRFGIVAFRDRTDADPTELLPLTDDVDRVHRTLMNLGAIGGGDYPEDVDAGLELAVNEQPWSEGAVHMVVLIGDAPPKNYPERSRDAILRQANRRQIRIHTIAASGLDARGHQVWSEIAERTGGVTDVLTYREPVRVAGSDRTLFRREGRAYVSRRALTEAERSRSFEELREEGLVEDAPSAVVATASRARATRSPARGGRRARHRSSGSAGGSPAAPASAAPVESDVGGIVTREARRAASEDLGVAY